MELNRLQAAAVAIVAAMAIVAEACRPSSEPAAKVTPPKPPSSGYQVPPEVTSVGPGPAGRIDVFGVASAGVAVRLATPSGVASFATAAPDGTWRMQIPASADPRMFGLSMSAGGRVVQSVDYLFVAPDGRTARLRAGGGSEVVGRSGPGTLVLDYDTQRAATLSGDATPGALLSLKVDGVERGQASADAGGRFVLPLNQPLTAGAHDLDLTGSDAEIAAGAVIGQPAQLSASPFYAAHSGAGWRIDWLTPGGGEQTTLILTAVAHPS